MFHFLFQQELIQNADDAGASRVKFLIDSRQHPRDPGGLWKPSLTPFQGPALLAWNNSVFSEDDWKNIGKMHQSQKEEDLLKVGRFGLGFQSVHHLTGVCSYIHIHIHYYSTASCDACDTIILKSCLYFQFAKSDVSCSRNMAV